MIVLATGTSGFLGRAVATALVDAGHEVRTLQRRPSHVAGVTDVRGTVTDATTVHDAARGVDAIVHLAAKVSLAGDPAEFRAVNVDGTRRLLDAADAQGVARFVYVSSPSVAHAGRALAGVGADPADPVHARGEYARTKAEAELLALGRNDEAMAVVAVRPHLVWGPGDTQLVARMVDRARRGTLPLLNGGTALIDSTYVDNAASGIVAAGALIERVWAVRPGSDEPPMTRFLAEQLSTAHWFEQRTIRRDLEWEPAVSLDEGLERLAAHYTG